MIVYYGYSQTFTNYHLSTMAIVLADSPYIHSCFNLSTTATSLHQPLSSAPKVAIVKRFNCIKFLKMPFYVHQEDMSWSDEIVMFGPKKVLVSP